MGMRLRQERYLAVGFCLPAWILSLEGAVKGGVQYVIWVRERVHNVPAYSS